MVESPSAAVAPTVTSRVVETSVPLSDSLTGTTVMPAAVGSTLIPTGPGNPPRRWSSTAMVECTSVASPVGAPDASCAGKAQTLTPGVAWSAATSSSRSGVPSGSLAVVQSKFAAARSPARTTSALMFAASWVTPAWSSSAM